MKNITLYLLFLTASMSACMEVIDLKHENSDPVLIVDGYITDQAGPYQVKLSTTVNFDAKQNSRVVENAIVTISDDLGEEEVLRHTSKGVYKTTTLQGRVGRTYTLNIDYEGKNYKAQSTLLAVKPIDLSYQKKEEDLYAVSIAGNSPDVNNINYYRWKIYKNGIAYSNIEDILVSDDEYIEKSFKFEFDYEFEANDVVKIEMLSLNKSAYDYYTGFLEVLQSDGGLFSPPPVNAPSNISNGALGIFRASAVVTKEIVITP